LVTFFSKKVTTFFDMPTITFIETSGARRTVSYTEGESVMETARGANVAGIIGECGGSCMCATCHVFLSEADFAKLPPIKNLEAETLEFVAADPRPTSRLGCQINLTPEMDGLVFHVAAA
jgi:2Fe-2S ferredoxin